MKAMELGRLHGWALKVTTSDFLTGGARGQLAVGVTGEQDGALVAVELQERATGPRDERNEALDTGDKERSPGTL